jgi:hypothetical protein
MIHHGTLALTALVGVTVAFAPREIPKPVAQSVVIAPEHRFETAWVEIVQTNVARKANKEPIRIIPIPGPTPVRTERIVVAADVPVSMPPVAVSLDSDKPVVQRRRHVDRRGICARHGMRKVAYGKRWRCRK